MTRVVFRNRNKPTSCRSHNVKVLLRRHRRVYRQFRKRIVFTLFRQNDGELPPQIHNLPGGSELWEATK